jgi:predicted ferric reductase
MLRRFPYVLGVVWLSVLFLLPLPLIQTLAQGLPSIYANEALAIQAGSIAYVWMLAAIYLATRPRWLDRLIGLPSVYMIHGILSLFAIVLAFLHKLGSPSAGWIEITGDWALYLLIALMVYSLVFMAGWLTSRVPPLARVKRWLEGLFKHEFSVWLHRLNLVATALVFIHVQLISYVTAIHPYMWLFDGYTALVAAAYVWAKVHEAYFSPRGQLAAVRELAPNFYEFTVRLRRGRRVRIAAGDYVFVSFPGIAGLRELHPFSVVNHVTGDYVVLAIRGDGDFTRAVQRVALGSGVRLTAGFGFFHTVIADHGRDRLVLVAGGSGVVPMIAVAQTYADRPVTLYYSAHSRADMIYVRELEDLARRRPNLSVFCREGRFDVDAVAGAEADAEAVYLLSGPSALGKAWKRALLAAGVHDDHLYYEAFTW